MIPYLEPNDGPRTIGVGFDMHADMGVYLIDHKW